MLAVALFACMALSPRSAAAATGCAPATVSGATITANETWTAACSPYIVTTNVTVRDGAILTIEPGVVVKFNSARMLFVATSGVAGKLVAAGTAQNPIRFTSNQATPTAGFWRGLVVNSAVVPGSILQHAIIEYAGVNPSLKLDGVSATAITIANVEIRQCTAEGVNIAGSNPLLDSMTINCPAATKHGVVATSAANFVIQNSTIANAVSVADSGTSGGITNSTFTNYDSGLPFNLHADRVSPIIGSNTVSGSTSSSIVNVSNGLLSQSGSWRAFSYRVTGNMNVRGSGSPMLTIQPGAEFRFGTGSRLIVSSAPSLRGGIMALGAASQPIRFTSNASTPAPGNWNGVQFQDGILPDSRLENVIIEYTGTGPALELIQTPETVALHHGTIRLCNGEGITANDGAPQLDDWSIACSAGNDPGVLTVFSPDLSLTNSDIRNGMDFADGTATAVITDNLFTSYNAGRPLRLHANRVETVLGANTLEGMNASSVVEIPDSTLALNATWPNLIYRILGDLDVNDASAPTLTLAPGTRMRFASGVGLLVASNTTAIRGGLMAVGTSAEPILFTSDAAIPAPGNWKGIRFLNGADDQSRLEWVRIEYTGSTTFPALEIYATDITVEHATIENNSKDGVTLRDANATIRSSIIRNNADDGIDCSVVSSTNPRPRIVDNQITNNTDRGVVCQAAIDLSGNTISGSVVGLHLTTVQPQLRVRNNNLSGNASKAIQNDDTGDGVDARLNWFGTTANPSAQFLGAVLANPWLGAAYVGPFQVREAAVSPESFRPDVNSATFEAQFTAASTWSLAITDPNQVLTRSFSGSGIGANQDWEGKDTGGTPAPNGVYRFQLDVQQSGTGFSAPPILGEVQLASGLMTAKIGSPEALQAVSGQVISVQGTASGSGFTSYTLDVAPGPNPQTGFSVVGSGTSAVTSGQLGSWNTAPLSAGIYTLRVRASGSGGATAEDRVTVKVLKVSALDTTPVYLSPNADGVLDTAFLSTTTTVPMPWTVTFKEPGGATVRTIADYGNDIQVTWDGRSDAGILVPDASYQVQVVAADPYSGATATVMGAAVVDVVVPTAAIDDPVAGTPLLTYDAVPIEGTAQDPNLQIYRLAYADSAAPETFLDFASSSGAVASGILGSLPGENSAAPLFSNGSLVVRLTVTDRAGNESEASTTLAIDRIEILNVSSSPVAIDPYDSDVSAISYELSRPANVTIEVHASGSSGGALVATRVNGALRGTGAHSDAWDGRDNSGAILPRGGYYFSIVASDGGGRSVRFNDPSNRRLGIAIPPYIGQSITYNGAPGLQGLAFNPYKNDVLQMQYTLSQSGRARVVVRPNNVGTTSPQAFEVGPPLHTAPGVPRGVLWDGRLPSGNIFAGTFGVTFDVPEQVEQDLVIISPPEVHVENLRTNPYVFLPTFAGVTNLSYTLARSAEVEIEVFDPNGNFLLTLQEPTVQVPGTYALIWNGRNQNDRVVTTEGSYRLHVRATDVQTGETVVRRGSALVYR